MAKKSNETILNENGWSLRVSLEKYDNFCEKVGVYYITNGDIKLVAQEDENDWGHRYINLMFAYADAEDWLKFANEAPKLFKDLVDKIVWHRNEIEWRQYLADVNNPERNPRPAGFIKSCKWSMEEGFTYNQK